MLAGRARLNAAGDTIVEVMMVLAILGLALGICYATANRSLLNTRQAQENSTATEIAQSQVEDLVAQEPDAVAGTGIFVPTSDTVNYRLFCLNGSTVTDFPDTAPHTLAAVGSDYTNYPSACTQQGALFHVADAYDDTSAGCAASKDCFTVQVIWDDVLGQGQDTVTLVYRLHP